MMTIDELKKIKQEALPAMSLRDGAIGGENIESKFKKQVLVCGDTGCASSKSLDVEATFRDLLAKNDLAEEVDVVRVGCLGLCEAGPVVVVYPGGTFYAHITAENAEVIVEEDLKGGNVVKDLVYEEAISEETMKSIYEVPFYTKQKKIALKNCGIIDPEKLEEYIANDGYFALHKSLTEMKPQDVIDVLKDSGLRGRGGGGFPAGLKWQFTADATGSQKYIICNADEGDPGAFMDRAILEGDPFSVLEAMTIAGYAIGSDQGYIYIRAEYPSAIKKLERSIERAKEKGLLGKDIFGTGFNFDIELRLGAGAFVCGEETALIASIEGERGMARNKPPFPAHKGLWGMPTLINNVETYANIAQIIYKGSDWFTAIGTEGSPGTKVFTLGGNIKNTGIIEVPMGITLREVIYDVGGGIPSGRPFKAVQTGGPSGGCITADDIDTPIEYETLVELGSMMGSGGMIVMDEGTCMVDIARFFLDFTVDESCGKCTPCREGTKRMLEILEKITAGEATMEDLERLESLASSIKDSSLCGLGQSAPNPVVSTLRYFRDEYISHIEDKKCPAGSCQALLEYFITDDCIGCGLCAKNCPVDCISGEKKEKHVIDQDRCIKCGNCQDVCPVKPVKAVIKR